MARAQFVDGNDIIDASAENPLPSAEHSLSKGIGGTTAFKLISDQSTNITIVKGSAGNLYTISAFGLSETIYFLKIYNTSTFQDFETDIPVMTIPVPPINQPGHIVISSEVGINFSDGITIAITKNVEDNDSGITEINAVVVNLIYA
jgi:hypothetical protein